MKNSKKVKGIFSHEMIVSREITLFMTVEIWTLILKWCLGTFVAFFIAHAFPKVEDKRHFIGLIVKRNFIGPCILLRLWFNRLNRTKGVTNVLNH